MFIAQAWAGQLPNSDALWVRMDEHADAAEIEDAVVDTVQHMLQPNMDVINDLQVCFILTVHSRSVRQVPSVPLT